MNEKFNKCDIPIFSELWYKVSKFAFNQMHKELNRDIAVEKCSHKLRTVYGLPCFCEFEFYQIHGKYIHFMTINLFFHINISNLYKSLLTHAERPIPLDAIDVYWRTISVPWPVINKPPPEHGPSEDGPSSDHEDDIAFEENMREFKNVFSKATSFVKKSMLTKVRGIF